MCRAILLAIALIAGSLPLYAVGLGLFVDELSFILMRGKTHTDNYSTLSLVGTAFFVVVVFFLQNYLVPVFAK